MQDEVVFSERAAAQFLKVSTSTLRRDRATGSAGRVPFARIGARVVYVREALEAWLVERQQRPAQACSVPAAKRVKRGRPGKREQIEAAQMGVDVPTLRARRAGDAA